MIEPIRPEDVGAHQAKTVPDFVLKAFNDAIASKYVNGSATVKQEDVVQAIIASSGLSRMEIFTKGWMNVEEIYRNAGWSVSYDKPGYNESYPATFEFKRKRS